MKQAFGIALLVSSVVLSAIAQLLLKMGASASRHAPHTSEAISLGYLGSALMHPLVIAGLIAYAGSMLGWLLVLSRYDLGYAYPFVALGIVLTTFLAWLFQGEPVSVQRALGIAIIIIGVLIVAKS